MEEEIKSKYRFGTRYKRDNTVDFYFVMDENDNHVATFDTREEARQEAIRLTIEARDGNKDE